MFQSWADTSTFQHSGTDIHGQTCDVTLCHWNLFLDTVFASWRRKSNYYCLEHAKTCIGGGCKLSSKQKVKLFKWSVAFALDLPKVYFWMMFLCFSYSSWQCWWYKCFWTLQSFCSFHTLTIILSFSFFTLSWQNSTVARLSAIILIHSLFYFIKLPEAIRKSLFSSQRCISLL